MTPLDPLESFTFITVAPQILILYPCTDDNENFIGNELDTELGLCQEVAEFADDAPQCLCETIEVFQDDFENYTIKEDLQNNGEDPLFDSRYTTNFGVDIVGADPNGEFGILSDYFFNPCRGGEGKCVDIEGSLIVVDSPINVLGIRDIEVEPTDALFQRRCTFNFHIRGNSRCGNNIPQGNGSRLSDEDAIELGCIQSYGEIVPLEDELNISIFADNNEIAFRSEIVPALSLKEDKFDLFGLTAPISSDATNISVELSVEGGQFNSGGRIGPIMDDIDIVCCCPDVASLSVGKVVDYFQPLAFDGQLVPLYKSDVTGLVGHVASYSRPYVYAIGLGGYIVIEFELGATGYINIYEESFHCCNFEDPEDASVEVSVDGVNWVLVEDSLKSLGYYTLKGSVLGNLRYAQVWLPFGACFKYVKITDKSDPDRANCDGFDLVAVEVPEPCCPSDHGEFPTDAPTEEPELEPFIVVGTSLAGSAIFAAIVAFVALAAIAVLAVMAVNKSEDAAAASADVEANQLELTPEEQL